MENGLKKFSLEEVPSYLLSLQDKFDQKFDQILELLLNRNSSDEPYGDFKWLIATCPGIPSSTLRIKSASGEIPGVVKFGKCVLYEKSVVLNWLRSQTRRTTDSVLNDQTAEAQFN